MTNYAIVTQTQVPEFPKDPSPKAVYRYTAALRKFVQRGYDKQMAAIIEDPAVTVSLLLSFMDFAAEWMETVEKVPEEVVDGSLEEEFSLTYRSYERVLDDYISEPESDGNLYTVAVRLYGLWHPAMRFLSKAINLYWQISL